VPPRKPRILVYGGSFDPPHRGHATLLYSAMAYAWPERAYVVPAFQHVLKGGHYSDVHDRLAMLTLTFNVESAFKVVISDIEAQANRPMYTWEVLDHFSALHPGHEVRFLLGDDCLVDFSKWARAEYLASRYTFMVGPRSGRPPLATGLPKLEIVPIRNPDAISSTDVRVALMDWKSVEGMVNPMVQAYIREHSLYGKTERVVEGSTK